MQLSTDRILTTHVGSLPRSKAVTDAVFAKENEQPVDADAMAATLRSAVEAVVARQVQTGVDIVSDGEMSKISYATYIKDRISGFDGDSERNPPADLEAFPGFLERQASSGGTPSYKRPCCVGEIAVKDMAPLQEDLDNFRAAVTAHAPTEGFMNAASPGVIALFQPNQYYAGHEAYLQALADAMRAEYEAIVDAGFILQLDSPDLGLGRHMLFKGKPEAEYVALANLHVEVLNDALRNIPAEKVRLHVCWGNYEGPHHCDAPMETVLPIALQAKPQALLFESSNPRHAHEWEVFRDAAIPDDKVLVPGVIDSTTNFIEHPRLVAQRIERFADIVGRERVIAGTDCGFSTFAGFGAVDEDIVYAKLGAMVEGAALASDRLWS
ncbi:cobalamin-independent methionine synthase II family protein [Pseudohalioglobus sediminis]|uniref:Cobalamin-independent methionine synthase II family protein n=1 Tax=Pseudohalioglobus sediminis TaxID=2606449 RepID=A0A5B0WTC8_9GAMM|nr:cobalamin-independent methionine synthase II family protein [Pseudohalioglobus sediminis]KAA1189129.1 cobalamin-independent methionine synthase II family protein [Pseudohalioglobus sediminis]